MRKVSGRSSYPSRRRDARYAAYVVSSIAVLAMTMSCAVNVGVLAVLLTPLPIAAHGSSFEAENLVPHCAFPSHSGGSQRAAAISGHARSLPCDGLAEHSSLRHS